MLIDICLPKFNIYQGTAEPVLRVTITLDVLFFLKKRYCLMSGLKFHLVQRNIVSTGQSVRA